jgi:hypothetical protein
LLQYFQNRGRRRGQALQLPAAAYRNSFACNAFALPLHCICNAFAMTSQCRCITAPKNASANARQGCEPKLEHHHPTRTLHIDGRLELQVLMLQNPGRFCPSLNFFTPSPPPLQQL